MGGKRNIPKGGTRGTIFRAVAIERLADADTLLRQRRYTAAVYLAGYAVECVLKFGITDRKGTLYLPAELETHNLDVLIEKAELRHFLQRNPKMGAVFADFADNWGPELRYQAEALKAATARRLYALAKQLHDWFFEII